MNFHQPSAGLAFGLGLLTAVQPCPMTANLAAVSYLGRRAGSPGGVLFAALLYAAGQMIAYVLLAFLVLEGIASAWRLSEWFEQHVNQILGPLWIVIAMVLLDLIRFRLPGVRIGPNWQSKVNAWGAWSHVAAGDRLGVGILPRLGDDLLRGPDRDFGGRRIPRGLSGALRLGHGAARARLCGPAWRRLAMARFSPESHAAGATLAEPGGRRSAAGGRHLLCAEVQFRDFAILIAAGGRLS